MPPVQPVTLGRVRHLLNREGLYYTVGEEGLHASFANGDFRIAIDDEYMYLQCHWRAIAESPSDQETLKDLCCEANFDRMGPHVCWVNTPEGLHIKTDVPICVALPMTEKQLHDSWTLAMNVTWSFFDELENRLPHLVTWEDEDDVE